MPSLFFGALNRGEVPADENVVRRNTSPVEIDAMPATQSAAPDFNEVETDSNTNLGLDPAQLSSHVIPTEKYAPFWAPEVDASDQHNAIIDRQVSSSGTAAARELSGQFGHGTLMVTEGIEPVQDLRDGGKMGNEYFQRNQREVQDGMGAYMSTPPGADQSVTARAAATGKTAAQKAREAAAYNSFYQNFMTGGA